VEAIEHYRRLVAVRPDDARVCNGLACYYATAPKPLRDENAAVSLAEKAMQLALKDAMIAELSYLRQNPLLLASFLERTALPLVA
jgi:hypothetical protein